MVANLQEGVCDLPEFRLISIWSPDYDHPETFHGMSGDSDLGPPDTSPKLLPTIPYLIVL